MVKAIRYPRKRDGRFRSVAADFPSYLCTSCGEPLRFAAEAYELAERHTVSEGHHWACGECVYGRLGLLW